MLDALLPAAEALLDGKGLEGALSFEYAGLLSRNLN